MKQLSISIVLLTLFLSRPVHAVSVGGIELAALADTVSASSGSFLNYTSATSADIISHAQVVSDLTDNSASTYVVSVDPVAYVDMAFSSVDIYNGEGDDLAIFFAGKIVPDTLEVLIDFDFDIDADGPLGSIRYTPEISPTLTVITDAFGSYTMTVALLNFDDFGLAPDQTLEAFRIYLGSNNSTSRPALSLVGGFHTEPGASVVPLPLPVLLFGSGLGLLGLFARRRS